jgi:hypothetical protein
LVVCDGGGCLRCVAESKVYNQSGRYRKSIVAHTIESDEDEDEDEDTCPPPSTQPRNKTSQHPHSHRDIQDRSAGPSMQHPTLPLPSRSRSSVPDKRPTKRKRLDLTDDDDDHLIMQYRPLPSVPHQGNTMSNSYDPGSTHHTMRKVQKTRHHNPSGVQPSMPTSSYISQIPSQLPLHVPQAISWSQMQPGTSSRAIMRSAASSSNPSKSSFAMQSRSRQMSSTLPTILETGRHRDPSALGGQQMPSRSSLHQGGHRVAPRAGTRQSRNTSSFNLQESVPIEDNMLRGSTHHRFDSFGGHGPQRQHVEYATEEEMDLVEGEFEDPPLDDDVSYGQDNYPLTQYGNYY